MRMDFDGLLKGEVEKAVNEEHKHMIKMYVRSEVPRDVKIISTKWVIRNKSNCTFKVRVKARGDHADGR